MKIIDFIITVFTIVDDFCQKYFSTRKLRQRGFLPKLADSEVISMEIIGEFMGFHTDKEIYQYFRHHWQNLFPQMPDISNFRRQAANLWKVKENLFMFLQTDTGRWLQILDSMPVEVCKFVRARYTRLFKNTAAYGKWFGRTFFGFRLHLKITRIGMIRCFAVTPANVHDIRCVDQLLEDDRGSWIVADKGYHSEPLRQRLWLEKGIYFHTSLRRNDRKTSILPKDTIKRLTGIRRLIETVAGQLEQQFAIKTTYARTAWKFLNRIIRKILSHTFGVFLNLRLNRDPLRLKGLLS